MNPQRRTSSFVDHFVIGVNTTHLCLDGTQRLWFAHAVGKKEEFSACTRHDQRRFSLVWMPEERAKALPRNLTILNLPFLSAIVSVRIPNAGVIGVNQKHGEVPLGEKANKNGHLRKLGPPSRGESGTIAFGVEGEAVEKALRAHSCLMAR